MKKLILFIGLWLALTLTYILTLIYSDWSILNWQYYAVAITYYILALPIAYRAGTLSSNLKRERERRKKKREGLWL